MATQVRADSVALLQCCQTQAPRSPIDSNMALRETRTRNHPRNSGSRRVALAASWVVALLSHAWLHCITLLLVVSLTLTSSIDRPLARGSLC